MSGSVIKSCSCKHEYQDSRYGKGNRVHCLTAGTKSGQKAVCTVCEAEK